jgi:hypothetical protein
MEGYTDAEGYIDAERVQRCTEMQRRYIDVHRCREGDMYIVIGAERCITTMHHNTASP